MMAEMMHRYQPNPAELQDDNYRTWLECSKKARCDRRNLIECDVEPNIEKHMTLSSEEYTSSVERPPVLPPRSFPKPSFTQSPRTPIPKKIRQRRGRQDNDWTPRGGQLQPIHETRQLTPAHYMYSIRHNHHLQSNTNSRHQGYDTDSPFKILPEPAAGTDDSLSVAATQPLDRVSTSAVLGLQSQIWNQIQRERRQEESNDSHEQHGGQDEWIAGDNSLRQWSDSTCSADDTTTPTTTTTTTSHSNSMPDRNGSIVGEYLARLEHERGSPPLPDRTMHGEYPSRPDETKNDHTATTTSHLRVPCLECQLLLTVSVEAQRNNSVVVCRHCGLMASAQVLSSTV